MESIAHAIRQMGEECMLRTDDNKTQMADQYLIDEMTKLHASKNKTHTSYATFLGTAFGYIVESDSDNVNVTRLPLYYYDGCPDIVLKLHNLLETYWYMRASVPAANAILDMTMEYRDQFIIADMIYNGIPDMMSLASYLKPTASRETLFMINVGEDKYDIIRALLRDGYKAKLYSADFRDNFMVQCNNKRAYVNRASRSTV
jgi:hypothetical protein